MITVITATPRYTIILQYINNAPFRNTAHLSALHYTIRFKLYSTTPHQQIINYDHTQNRTPLHFTPYFGTLHDTTNQTTTHYSAYYTLHETIDNIQDQKTVCVAQITVQCGTLDLNTHYTIHQCTSH